MKYEDAMELVKKTLPVVGNHKDGRQCWILLTGHDREGGKVNEHICTRGESAESMSCQLDKLHEVIATLLVDVTTKPKVSA